MAAILAMAAFGAWAVLTDRISYTVTHGISMNPVYYQGDLVIVLKSDHYRVGEIAEYRSPSAHEDVLHRIVGGDATSGFIFKGDNNKSIDTLTPTPDKIVGRAVLHVPHGGIWLKPLLGPTGLGMMSFLIVGGGAAAPRSRREIPRGRRKKRVKAMSGQAGFARAGMAVLKAVAGLPPLLRVAAAATALTAVLSLTLGVLGWMKPIYQIKSSPGVDQSVAYSYSAVVPRSAAYDSTTVSAPDPVFRKVTNKVNLQMRYRGPAGTLGMSAELTNGTGWHTTMVVEAARRFASTSLDITVPLDLDAFDRRAQAAADATGLQGAQVLITLTTRVIGTGVPDFDAPVKLILAPLTLTLADHTGNLQVTNTAAATTPHTVIREITIFGVSLVTAPTARSWALLLLILTGAAAVILLIVGRRRLPVHNRAEIEQRFPQMLVHVEPMASPPGKPVVNVDNFPALVKLAERYGQMILTWRRPDADDFVVRDEGITYRYRVPLDEDALLDIEHRDRPSGAGSHRRRATSEVS